MTWRGRRCNSVDGVEVRSEARWWGNQYTVTAESPFIVPEKLILFVSERGMDHGFWRDLRVGDPRFDSRFFVFCDEGQGRRARAEPPHRDGPAHRRAAVDDGRDEGEGEDEALHVQPEDRLPEEVARLRALEVKAGDVVGNDMRASAFQYDLALAKLGKTVDRDEWLMTPMTVNAYYQPTLNEIVFPAAILQPPFFDANADAAVNYAASAP